MDEIVRRLDLLAQEINDYRKPDSSSIDPSLPYEERLAQAEQQERSYRYQVRRGLARKAKRLCKTLALEAIPLVLEDPDGWLMRFPDREKRIRRRVAYLHTHRAAYEEAVRYRNKWEVSWPTLVTGSDCAHVQRTIDDWRSGYMGLGRILASVMFWYLRDKVARPLI